MCAFIERWGRYHGHSMWETDILVEGETEKRKVYLHFGSESDSWLFCNTWGEKRKIEPYSRYLSQDDPRETESKLLTELV